MRFFRISFIAALLAVAIMPRWAAALEIQDVRKGVVRIISIGDNGSVSTGTGFVINDSGNIITNHHVIANALSGKSAIKVLTDDLAEQLKPEIEQKFGSRVDAEARLVDDKLIGEILVYLLDKLPDATVKWSDQKLDLAILSSSSSVGLSPLRLSTSNLISEGQTVYALGYPGKSDKVGVTAFLTLKTLNGIVASKDFVSSSGVQVYQTTAPFSGGNSGGPLVTDCGEVIGINSFDIGQRIGNVSVGESIRYSIQVDELITQLDRQGIDYEVARSSCSPQAQGMSWLTIATLGFAIMLALAAVIIASTGRGRRAVKNYTRRYTGHLSPAPMPAPLQGGMPVIRGIQGEYAGKIIEPSDRPLVIGRDPAACQIVFPPSLEDISKRHCVLRYDPSSRTFTIEDSGSTNGTFIVSGGKSERLLPGQVRRLNPGDRFYLGGPENMFEMQLAPAFAPAPGPAPMPQPGRREAAVLMGLQGEFAGKTVELGGASLVIGRDPRACQLVFPSSLEDVSKRHCALRYDPASRAFALEDLGSTNGTFVVSGGRGDQLKPGEVRRISPNGRFYLGDPGILFEVKLEYR
ncbi:MAG: FHA domain-containing protein [Blastocatellia bacterium]|nr:FHA domain-containing protein [Blastocatellia bacterium]